VRALIAWILLGAGAAVQVLAVAGVLLIRDALDRLHYVAPSALAAVLIAAAIVVRESFSQIGIVALLLAGFLVFSGPVLAHVTGRAILLARRESSR
jgi:multisubunit Na+/H+ antiporter MnhG subunit